MRIATWNVNSVKAHIEQVTRWLGEAKPDVVCLQEIKCEDQGFPAEVFEGLGYQCAVHGQKTYNGVALLSRYPIENIVRGLPGEDEDVQSRFISGTIISPSMAVQVASIYLPNGNPSPGEKYDYKLRWMARLAAQSRVMLASEEPLVLCGDYNVIPAAEDAKHPQNWTEDALFRSETRAAFQTLLNLGLTEAFRSLHPGKTGHYSFWDYQAWAWPKNNGIRIDHHLLSPQAADRLISAQIDSHVRGWERPSDHVPVVIEIN
jgi:exodeoxyribonuclease III